jgi:polyisoprenoid-binding protein YceI
MVARVRLAGACMFSLVFSLVALIYRPSRADDLIPSGKVAVLELDSAKTNIAYSLSGWPHNTHETFKLKHGLIRIDPATGKMNGVITVDAASGTSGEMIRDTRMRSSILEASRFPEISFAPQRVVSHGNLQGTFPVKVQGLLSLHGTQHEYTFDASVSGAADTATIHCTFAVPYVDWGLEDPSILMFKVSKQVIVDVTANARLSWIASTPISAAMPNAMHLLAASGSASLQSKAQ